MTSRKNFSDLEIEALFSCIGKYHHIIENKTSNATVNRQKQEAWCAIENDFNSMPGVLERTSTQLLNLYKNLKRKAKVKSLDQLELLNNNGEAAENTSTLNDKILAVKALKSENSSDNNKCYFLITTTSNTSVNAQDIEKSIQFVVPATETVSDLKLISVRSNASNLAEDTNPAIACPKIVSVASIPAKDTPNKSIVSPRRILPNSMKSNAFIPRKNDSNHHPAVPGETGTDTNSNCKDTGVTLPSSKKRFLSLDEIPSKRTKNTKSADSINTSEPSDVEVKLKKELLLEEHKQAMEHREEEHQLKMKILSEKMKIMAEKCKFWQKMHERLSKTDIAQLDDK